MSRQVLAAAVAATALGAARADAALHSYYIGVDGLGTLTTGTYAGLANPNHNHLTLLYAHHFSDAPSSNHYHSKGARVYTGPVSAPAVIRSSSDFVPEGTIAPIPLSGGSGLYAGKLVTTPIADPNDVHYDWSRMTMANTDSLNGFAPGTGEHFLFNSSGGRWTPAAAGAHLHAEIVNLTPGLNVGDATSLNIGGVGDELHLTSPGNFLNFTPVLWTDSTAANGTYEAVFRFFDEDGAFGDSGNIRFRVQVIPEPATLSMLAGVGVMLVRRRRI